MTTLFAILAVADNGVIGQGGELPWNLPADLRRFRRLTAGLPCIMGRRTFETLPSPLVGRSNLLINRDTIVIVEVCKEKP